MTTHSLAIKNKDGEYERFTVPKEVSQYIKQLEAYIEYPDRSKLREVYKDRFGKDPRANLLKVLKDDFAHLTRICKDCSFSVEKPCECATQLRIEVLEMTIRDAENHPAELETPIEINQELDFEGIKNADSRTDSQENGD